MVLFKLIENILPEIAGKIDQKLEITGISCDSRLVKPGNIYVAIAGSQSDGKKFINDAIAKGAKCIIFEGNKTEYSIENEIIYLEVANSRLILTLIASKFYQQQPQNIVAVTGTNGKSSVVHYFRCLLQMLGQNAASIGTIGVIGDLALNSEYHGLTTPGPVELYNLMSILAEHKIDYAAIEGSSHGLDQYRLHGLKIKAAAFTSFSQDHLDYHKDMQDYLAAKLKLFNEVMKDGVAVLNGDIEEFDQIKEAAIKNGNKIISYGSKAKDLVISHIENNINYQSVDFSFSGKEYSFKTGLIGEFQAYNILCAIGLAVSVGYSMEQILPLLGKLPPVPGRMEKVTTNNHLHIIVDYAHSPDALEKTLLCLKPLTKGRLIVMFGCGGNRDKGKRPKMGQIAAQTADLVIVTDDNPRFEDPAIIRNEIIVACPKAIEIAGREEAIKTAIEMMKKDDVLLIAGKGHEKMQIVKEEKIPFDDVLLARHYADLK